MSACTQDYVNRLRKIGQESPELLVAHAYTRYLGDLSGGRVLMRVAKKALALPLDGSGTAFYRFDAIANGNQFKKRYRTLLDNITVTTEMADRIVSEANIAFVMNMRVFEELDVLAGDAVAVRTLATVMATLEMPIKKENKCPFAVLGGPNPHKVGTTTAAAAAAAAAAANVNQVDAAMASKSECPWPFILLHDPKKGLQNPWTWLALVVVLLGMLFPNQLKTMLGY